MQEVKKLDDMVLLVDIHLTETKVQQALENLPKAKVYIYIYIFIYIYRHL